MRASGRNRWSKTIGYFFTFAALGMATAILGPTLPSLAENAQSQLGGISYLFTALSVGYMFGSLLGGQLYDRVAGHRLLVIALLLLAAMLFCIPLVSALGLLTAAWLILGIAGGTLDVGGNTLLVWVHGRQVAPFMNGLHFFFGAGSFLAPAIVAQTAGRGGGIAPAYWLLALLVLPVAGWLAREPSPRSQAAFEEGGSTASRSNIPRHPAAAADDHRIVVLVALLLLLYVGAEAAFGGWIFTYAVAQSLSDARTAALLTSAFWGALTVGRLLGIPIAARVRPRAILLTDLVGCLASVGAMLLWPSSAAVAWAGTVGLGLAMASIFPSAISLAEERVSITGRVTGWFLVGSSIGAMSLPWLIGQLFASVGPRITMIAILLDLFVATGVLVILIRHATRLRQV
jgi:FHS family Na+ dependent glucose MFS transporter 1